MVAYGKINSRLSPVSVVGYAYSENGLRLELFLGVSCQAKVREHIKLAILPCKLHGYATSNNFSDWPFYPANCMVTQQVTTSLTT